jgi:hypothetical protein
VRKLATFGDADVTLTLTVLQNYLTVKRDAVRLQLDVALADNRLAATTLSSWMDARPDKPDDQQKMDNKP